MFKCDRKRKILNRSWYCEAVYDQKTKRRDFPYSFFNRRDAGSTCITIKFQIDRYSYVCEAKDATNSILCNQQ